jgi:biopolymer transport protein ExbD
MNEAERPAALWDVFHSNRLELERGLSTESIRVGLKSGALDEDDLVRPAGTTNPWVRIAEIPELMAPPSANPAVAAKTPPANPARPETATAAPRVATDYEVEVDESLTSAPAATPMIALRETIVQGNELDDITFPVIRDDSVSSPPVPPPPSAASTQHPEPPAWIWEDDDDHDHDEHAPDSPAGLEIIDDDSQDAIASRQQPAPSVKLEESSQASLSALPVVGSRDRDQFAQDPPDEEEQFSLSRSGPMTVEELDLAPMVDVALQLVLFFMVTATTVLFKSLEIPKPSPETPPPAVTQGRSRTLDDLKDDFILVEIDSGNAVKIDREPAPADRDALIERLTRAREKTGRKAMLLSTDYRTLHRYAVLACDAANEIGLQIKVATPAPPQPTKGPGLLGAPASPPANAPVAG